CRHAIEEIIVRTDQDKKNLALVIHWKGGAHTQLAMERPRSVTETATPMEALEIIRRMAVRYGDDQIASVLNRLGHSTGKGKRWNQIGPVAGLVGIEGGVVSEETSNHPALKRQTGDHAMTSNITKTAPSQGEAQTAPQLFDDWFDPIETAVRQRAREFIEELIRSELDAALARPRYERSKKAGGEETPGVTGHRHGSRTRSLTGSFGPIGVAVPRARLTAADGQGTEWESQSLRAYQRRTLTADALIAGCYLAGTNCWLSSACVRTVRKCCSRLRVWAARVPKPGVLCSTISSGAACAVPNSSLSTARRG